MSVERIRGVSAALLAAALLALGLAAPAGSAESSARARASLIYPGPTVEIMVVGAGNKILDPSVLGTLPSTTVQTSHGVCRVGLGLPLDGLAELARSRRISFAVHDYGHCDASAQSSGQLFVTSVDGETNHGQNGWEYKIDGRSGSAGAADPSGPFGNGKPVPANARLLWFWCQSFGGGCQRTLEISAPRSVRRGATFPVSVSGADNNGNGEPMSGARVTAGAFHSASAAAVTSRSGRVMFRAPSRATLLTVNASRPGSVPAFPVTVQVR